MHDIHRQRRDNLSLFVQWLLGGTERHTCLILHFKTRPCPILHPECGCYCHWDHNLYKW